MLVSYISSGAKEIFNIFKVFSTSVLDWSWNVIEFIIFPEKKEWLYANQCSLFNSWSNLLALQQQALWILFYNCSEASLRIYLCWCTPAVCGLFMNPSELWLFFELLAAWCYWPCCSFITRVPFITPRLTDIVVERDWMQSFMPLPLASGAFQLPSLQDNW